MDERQGPRSELHLDLTRMAAAAETMATLLTEAATTCLAFRELLYDTRQRLDQAELQQWARERRHEEQEDKPRHDVQRFIEENQEALRDRAQPGTEDT